MLRPKVAIALLIVACATVPAVRQNPDDEHAVFAAILADPYTFDAPGMREHPALADLTDLHEYLQRWPRDGEVSELCELEFKGGGCTAVPRELPRLLTQVNQKPTTVGDLGLRTVHLSQWSEIPPGVTRILVLSKPAIDSQGTRALIAIRRVYPQPNFGPDGFMVYLEKHGGIWHVIRHGAQWIV